MSTEDDTSGQYRCCINQCPMTGAIFLAGPHAPGICGFHFGHSGHAVARVTQILLDWECVTYEINVWRRALLSVEIDKAAVAKAWTRLQPALGGGWDAHLAPVGESYASWGRKLERFIEARLKDALQGAATA